jgi:hypothetical protein
MTHTVTPVSDDTLGHDLHDCPYKGLGPYTEVDGEYFFGREAERDLIIANLMASRLTVLCGPSGVGKSSLLQAGVLRELRNASDGGYDFMAADRIIAVYFSDWRDDPLVDLGLALANAIPQGHERDALLAARAPLSLELLNEVTRRLDADVYLILDQFEEEAIYQVGQKGEGTTTFPHGYTFGGHPVSCLSGWAKGRGFCRRAGPHHFGPWSQSLRADRRPRGWLGKARPFRSTRVRRVRQLLAASAPE